MIQESLADAGEVDAGALIDRSRFSGFQRWVIFLCALVYLLDGYDTLAIAYTAPLLANVVHVPMSGFGVVFSTGILGATFGTFGFGVIGDRIGRKWSLVAACALFSVFSFLTIWATTLPSLLVLRFLTGLGLGGATPLFVVMATEYAPKRARGLAMSVVYAAFPLGGVIGGLVSTFLVPSFGWQAVFLIGGVVPLAIAGMLVVSLPESIRFLLARGDQQDAVRRILARMDVGHIPTGMRVVSLEAGRGGRVGLKRLVSEVRPTQSMVLWLMFFTVFMVIMTLSTWTPSLLRSAGVPLATASMILAANSFGAIIGTIGSGYLFDRFGPQRVLLPQLVLTAVFVGLYGPVSGSPLLLGLVAMLAGVFVSGASTCLFAIAGSIYSTEVRSTGTGVALGFGRIGQLIGPLVVGALLGRQFGIATIFLAAAFPCAIAALASAIFTMSGAVRARPASVVPARGS